jgi:RNA polymerase sigma-70 factor, ECF subfamily
VATTETDPRLAGLLRNDPAAVAQIAGWIRSIAAYHRWGLDSPEDIVQETMVVLLRNAKSGAFRGGDLRSYVQRIAMNLCISSYRKARRHGVEVPMEGRSLESPSGSNGGSLERSQLARRILEELDETCRNLIMWVYFHGLSRQEVGERLGISEGAARVRLYRCLEKARAG